MAGRSLLVVCVCIGICVAVPSTDPLCGMKIRITEGGLNYANTVLIDNLRTKSQGSTVADMSHTEKHLQFQLTKNYVRELSIPNSHVTLLKGNGIKWSARDVNISVSSDYSYRYEKKIGFIPIKISDHGGLDVSMSGGSFDVWMKMGMDDTNRPSIATSSCNCNIATVSVKFSGGSIGTIIYNLLHGLIGSYLKDVLKKNLCDTIKGVVNHDLEKSLQRVRIDHKIGDKFQLDYGLLKAPEIHTESIESFLKGNVNWKNTTEPMPFDPSPFPNTNSTDKMVYVWVSGYMFNSLSYQAERHGILKRTLTNGDFDDAFLNTSCKFGSVCIGKFLPQLTHSFPNEVVEVDLMSRKAPNIALIQGKLHLTMNGTMTMHVKRTSASERQYLFTMDTDMTSVIDISYAKGYLHSKLKKMNFNVCISNSTLHPIYERALNFIMQNIVKDYIKPKLDGLGKTGLPLIKSDDIRLKNTDIQLSQDALIIGTDLEVIKE